MSLPGERLALAGLACFVVCLSLVPVLRLAFEAVAPGGTLDLGLARDVLTAPATLTATWHSLVTAFFGTCLSLILGTALALLVALTDMRRKAIIVFLFLLPLMIPPQVTALAWAQLFGPSSPLLVTLGLAPPIGSPNPIYSPEGIVLLLGVQHAPLVFLAVRAGLRNLPRELIEAARACGAGPARTLFGIALPVVMPSLVAGGALAFVSAIGNFGIPALIGIPAGYTVLPTLIYQRLASFGPSIISEVAVLSVLVGCLAFAGFAIQRLVLGRRDYRTLGGTGAPLAVSLGRWRAAFEAAAWIVLALILILPLVALFATSLVSAYGVPLGPGTATLSNYAEVLLRQDATVRAFRNSTFLALTAALVLMVVAVPFAAFVVWRRSRLLSLLSGFAEIPYALPGIVLGIAAILLFLKPLPFLGISLYNTIWIILVAYLARFLTLSLRPVIAGVEQVDPALEEAARMSGASYLFRLRTILFPILAPSAAAGAILTFMTAFNELTVSALLWSSGNETLGVVVFNLDDGGYTVLASAVAMVTVVVIVAIMGLTAAPARFLPKGVLPWL